nr:DNA recombination protein RmuC homolog [Nerophis lumbriciformis]
MESSSLLSLQPWLAALISLATALVVGFAVALWSLGRQRLLESRLAAADEGVRRLEATREQLASELGESRQAHEVQEARTEDALRRLAVLDSEHRQQTEQLAEQRRLLSDAESRLGDTFSALGTKVFRANSEQFMELASQTFDKLRSQAKGDVEQKQVEINALVKPLKEMLERQNQALGDLETRREVAYRGLEEQIKTIASSHQSLHRETRRLTTALRRPEQRGRWGELQLRNVVELAGMTEHCDFELQPATDDPSNRYRPDMTVRMPGGGVIVVDSKVALDAYLDSLEADSEAQDSRLRHANQVQQHYKTLASKRYWDQFADQHTPKLVVMFMPLESALVAALETKPDLHTKAMQNHVLIATPTLLVALLRSVAYGWQQESIAENARKISLTGKELYGRLAKFVEHFERIGTNLGRAGTAYNDAVGSLERRVLPAARDLKDLHATSDSDIEPPALPRGEVRQFSAPELRSGEEMPAADPAAKAGTET